MYRRGYIMVPLLLIAAFSSACDITDESISAPVTWQRHALTLKDFWDDPTLAADPRNLIAVTFRETPGWVSLPAGCKSPCIAVIPYYLDRAADFEFQWPASETESQTYVVLQNENGQNILTMVPGDEAVDLFLPSGSYRLQVMQTDTGDRTALYVQPSPDIDSPLFDADTTPYPQALIFHSGECEGCNLSGGNLLQAFMAENRLNNANLSGANLLQADLEKTDLTGANLDGANVFQTKLAFSNLKQASLAGTNVFQSDFSGAILTRAAMPGINAPEASFFRAGLQYADISGAILGYINGEGTDFSQASLKGTILIYSTLIDAHFCGADLSEADLTGADVTGADFTGADLTGAVWIDGTTCTGATVNTCQ
jgi:uncharacterized protein YjbI with pentapeptide repeats